MTQQMLANTRNVTDANSQLAGNQYQATTANNASKAKTFYTTEIADLVMPVESDNIAPFFVHTVRNFHPVRQREFNRRMQRLCGFFKSCPQLQESSAKIFQLRSLS